MSNLIKIGRNNELKRATLELPKYGELTDERVVQEMRGVFDGFEYDPDTQVETVFKTVEQIETYAAEVSKELEQADNDFKMAAITNAGAIAAKRWHFGFMISKCLKASKYGEGVANKIAAAANISLPYLYQYRAVGDNLSIRDAYILGMYGAGWDCIRQVAAVNDPDTRQNLIQYFVQSITDWNNSVAKEQAKEALKSALSMLKHGPAELDVSSPAKIETAVNFESEAPEFMEAKKQLQKLMTACRGIVKDNKLSPMLKAFGDCYLADNVPDAEAHLDTLHEDATSALELLQQVESVLPQLKEEVTSLQNMGLSHADS